MKDKKTANQQGHLPNRSMNVLLALADEKFAFVIADIISKYHWSPETRFHALYVVEEPSIKRTLAFAPDLAEQVIYDEESYGRRLLTRVEKRIHESLPSACIVGHFLRGYAKKVILEKAAEIQADLIVVGAHGRTGIVSMLLGSVSLYVLTHADCSVLVVRIPTNKPNKT